MNKKQSPSQKKRGATVAAVLCFVAAIAIVGTYTLGNSREARQNEEIARTEENETKDNITEDSADDAREADSAVIDNQNADKTQGGTAGTGEEEKETAGGNSDADGNASGSGTGSSGAGGTGVQSTSGSGVNLNFGEDSKLVWPVNGTVLMSYSMDKTVYFSTLDQYKYNPALIISAAENDQVIAGTTGIVKSIDNMAETGTTVNIDIGNGYELLYGQLKDVPLKVGDYVEANTVIGYVSKPTKYYSVEGTNVYFEMRKDGQPINPLDYM